MLDNGNKVGFQAKYFLEIDDSQWVQLDKSVETALTVHPELVKYFVALPRDLTAKKQGKGQSQTEKWQARVEKWKGWADEKEIEIEFELWSATILEEMLLRPENTPLIKFWFGEDVLNNEWFSRHVQQAECTLGDRFNPDDHVGVEIEQMFDILVRGKESLKRLEEAFKLLQNARIPSAELEFSVTELKPDEQVFANVSAAKTATLELSPAFLAGFAEDWKSEEALERITALKELSWEQRIRYQRAERDGLCETDRRNLASANFSFKELTFAADDLHELLSDKAFLAEKAQCSLIHGPAGAGKSHVLGEAAVSRTSKNLPTIVLLGQSFSNGAPIWEQIGGILGLRDRTSDAILGALDAAGERLGSRTLIIFDAINEGAGASFWRQNLEAVIAEIQRYKHLAVIFSCREEYIKYTIPASLQSSLPSFYLEGFSSDEELERAAIQYLEKRGIARPNTPWLSPEFRNPLFLKTTSEAISAKGEFEFPKGMNGISQVLALYLDAISWRMGFADADPSEISSSIKECVRMIAGEMATEGKDFVKFEKARHFASTSFKDRRPPEGKTWLEVLIEVSLFRRDPLAFDPNFDPMAPPPEVIRFSFQRFQHHLTAVELVEKVDPERLGDAFIAGGPLNFLFYDGVPDNGIRYENAGLVAALSTIFPEKLGCEFAKCLPKWKKQWKQEQILQSGFVESFRWRNLKAFTEDTRAFLNALGEYSVSRIELLLEVSMTSGHPFNAETLHSKLIEMNLAQRDNIWTREVNLISVQEFNQLERIVSWATGLLERPASVEHSKLASIVLCWSLSSSHITLRDRATKALTTIFLVNPDAFGFLVEKFHSCDDPYVIERLYAASFGGCCLDPRGCRLKDYSAITFARVFAAGEPPIALLTRDYALGIIELADQHDALSSDVDLKSCYPPFQSDAPVFGLDVEGIERIAVDCGGDEILRSASSEWGDYGKYSIPGRVRAFLTTRLSETAPLHFDELKKRFYNEIIEQNPDRVAALERLERHNAYSTSFLISIYKTQDGCEDSAKEQAAAHEHERNQARLDFESLLSAKELSRYQNEYARENRTNYDYERVDISQCRLWITRRAYELGWSEGLFPRDGYGASYSRHHNDLERIGKKYQRIALDEIQARLSDNFWTAGGWPETPHVYRYSHHDYRRNLEPTILPDHPRFDLECSTEASALLEPRIKLPEIEEDALKAWPFIADPAASMETLQCRQDNSDQRWRVLYEHALEKQKYPEEIGSVHSLRCEEFRFLFCAFLKKGTVDNFCNSLEQARALDTHYFQPRECTDEGFLLEAPWRETWNHEKFSRRIGEKTETIDYAIPVASYHWESNLDKTLSGGFSACLPEKWFADELRIRMSPSSVCEWIDESSNTVVRCIGGDGYVTAVLIREEFFEKYCEQFSVEPVWLMIAERGAWPGGNNSQACYRRSEGAIWLEGEGVKKVNWHRDSPDKLQPQPS